jgi:hypothetical protein
VIREISLIPPKALVVVDVAEATSPLTGRQDIDGWLPR